MKIIPSSVDLNAGRENHPGPGQPEHRPRHIAQAAKIVELCDRLSEINVLRLDQIHQMHPCMVCGPFDNAYHVQSSVQYLQLELS
jgi:hypothetical protein